jgi:hypothetical protein
VRRRWIEVVLDDAVDVADFEAGIFDGERDRLERELQAGTRDGAVGELGGTDWRTAPCSP